MIISLGNSSSILKYGSNYMVLSSFYFALLIRVHLHANFPENYMLNINFKVNHSLNRSTKSAIIQ